MATDEGRSRDLSFESNLSPEELCTLICESAAAAGIHGQPARIDDGGLVMDIGQYDRWEYAQLREICDDIGFSLPDYDEIQAQTPNMPEEDEQEGRGIALDAWYSEDVAMPEFGFTAALVGDPDGEELRQTVEDAACLGLGSLIPLDPMALRMMGRLKPEWDIEWYSKLAQDDDFALHERVRYNLGDLNANDFRAALEGAVCDVLRSLIMEDPQRSDELFAQAVLRRIATTEPDESDGMG